MKIGTLLIASMSATLARPELSEAPQQVCDCGFMRLCDGVSNGVCCQGVEREVSLFLLSNMIEAGGSILQCCGRGQCPKRSSSSLGCDIGSCSCCTSCDVGECFYNSACVPDSSSGNK
jgi:hypothetical protein